MELETLPYYLRHFRSALDWLAGSRAHLLGQQDLAFIERFVELSESAQGLWVRLTLRSRAHFKRSQLNYPELEPLDHAIDELVSAELISLSADLTANEYFHLASKADLDQRGVQRTKADHWPNLAEQAPRTATAWGLDQTVITHTSRTQADRLRLAFFGQLHQDWSEFVLSELGIRDYPDYAITAEGGFQDRAEFEACWALEQHLARFEGDLVSPAACQSVAGLNVNGPTFRRRRQRLVHQMARQLERQGDLEEALAMHQSNNHPESRLRCLRLLEADQPTAAWRLAQQIQLLPDSEAELQAIQPARRRLAKRLGLGQITAPRFNPIEKTLSLELHGHRVEQLCARALADEHQPVIYSENALFTLLFRLHHWDVLYAPITGAFFNPFQYLPADLYQPEFRSARAHLWPKQVCPDRLRDNYRRAPDSIRQAISPELLDTILDCMPPADLDAIFDRIWVDPKANRSGFPDLIRLDLKARRYELIEVKGPGDRLQAHQRRWLEYFDKCGITAWVCHVQDASLAAL